MVLEAGEYASAQEARSVWEGSPPVEVTDEGALRLPANFDSSLGWHMWKRSGDWDLSACRRIIVDTIESPDRQTPFVQMMLRLHSDGGWYSRIFQLVRGDCRIELPRRIFGTIDGTPGGWHKVDRILLGVRSSRPIPQAIHLKSQAIHLKSMRAVVGEPRVAIYQNDAGAGRESNVVAHAQKMAARLDRLEIDCQVLDDDSVASGKLAGFEMVILPMNPVLPAPAAAAIEEFVGRGGKLIVCGPLPGPLGRILGVKGTDGNTRPVDSGNAQAGVTEGTNGFYVPAAALTGADRETTDRMLFSMIRRLSPGAMRQLYERRESDMGRDAGLAGSAALEEEIAKNLKASPDGKEARKALAAARLTLADAQRRAQSGDFADGAELLKRAEQEYLRSYVHSVPGKPGEIRLFWCNDPRGTDQGRDGWDSAVKSLARGGFNAVATVVRSGGWAVYESKLLPKSPAIRKRGGDLLAECVAAGKKHGVAVYAIITCYRLGGPGSTFPEDKSLVEKLYQANRLHINTEGKLERGRGGKEHLCPSNPDNQKLELESILEVARNYDVAGIILDYIRYVDVKHCYCDGCRRRFEEQYKLTVENWPADVYTGALKEQYRQFRRDNITSLVAAVSRGVRQIKPDVQVSAAVLTDGPLARDAFAQDWKLWLEKGYLDWANPMTQASTESAAFKERVRLDCQWGGVEQGNLVLPTMQNEWLAAPGQVLQQVVILRKYGAAGFHLENYGARWQAEQYGPFFGLEAPGDTTGP